MSSVKIEGNASGTGIFTIASPNSNTNRTLTLPDVTGTFNTSGGVNEVPAGSASAAAIYPTGDTNTGPFFPAADTIAWTTGGSERMRIDSSGNVGIGTTPSYRIHVVQSSNADVVRIENTNASFNQDLFRTNTTRAANSAFNILRCQANSVDQFYVTGAGVIYAQNTTVQSVSDIRTKENIRNSDEGLNVITALRPVRFDFKEGFGNDRKDQLGFIAQEVESVFPDAVGEWKQDGETYKSVGPGALIPVFVKAIQELKAELDATKAEVAALKGQV